MAGAPDRIVQMMRHDLAETPVAPGPVEALLDLDIGSFVGFEDDRATRGDRGGHDGAAAVLDIQICKLAWKFSAKLSGN